MCHNRTLTVFSNCKGTRCFMFYGAGDKTPSHKHDRQVFYHQVTSPVHRLLSKARILKSVTKYSNLKKKKGFLFLIKRNTCPRAYSRSNSYFKYRVEMIVFPVFMMPCKTARKTKYSITQHVFLHLLLTSALHGGSRGFLRNPFRRAH